VRRYHTPQIVYQEALMELFARANELNLPLRDLSLSFQCKLILGPYLAHQKRYTGLKENNHVYF
jgi:P2-related tail formation protein